MNNKEANITEQTIKQLVDNFYAKIKKDPDLGPVFSQAIGESYEDWRPHLEKMYDFWGAIMLGGNKYRGNPVKKHKDLPSFDGNLFNRWLRLFSETVDELHSVEIASEYKNKSYIIAGSLKRNLYSQVI